MTVSTGAQACDADYLERSRLDVRPKPGIFVYLEVADSGVGMDAETLSRLFDPFFTTKFIGRGLGMPATLGIVRGQGGAVMVNSEVGVGTTVRLLFAPLSEPAAPGPAARRPATDAEPTAESAAPYPASGAKQAPATAATRRA